MESEIKKIFIELNLGQYWQMFQILIVFFSIIAILRLVKHVMVGYLKRIAQKTENKFDDHLVYAIEKLGLFFYIGVSLYVVAHYFFSFEKETLLLLDKIVLIIFTFYAIRWIGIFTDFFTEELIKKDKEEGQDSEGILHLGNQIVKYTTWIIAILFILTNFGIEIGPLLAGASIGGIAIAFAMQNILSDIFSSFSIYFDKPFRIGDLIVIGQDSGIVRKIGIKSTRLTSLQGEEIIISNKMLTESKINNYKRMEKRRVVFQIGVTYETPIQKLKKIPKIIKKIIEEDKDLEVDRVNFIKFGDFALIFEIAYFVRSNSYATYAAKQEQINLKIMEEFKKEKISFAYPTQLIYYHKF
ncbi:MAG: mechanosensitive ion channel family protein [Candidatus Anstonellaceae archaeon]